MAENPQPEKPLELALGDATPRSRAARVITVILPFIGLMLVIIPFSIFIPNFLTPENFKTVAIQTTVVAIAGMGMTFVIIGGGIDLSVGSVIAFSMVATALALKWNFPPFTAILCGIAAGGLCGFLNGAMITVLRIVPFIATLGMLGIARGAAKLLAKEQSVYVDQETWVNDIMLKMPKEEWLALEPEWFAQLPEGIRQPIEEIVFSPGLWILLFTVIAMWLIMRYTTFGRYTIAIGSNEATARLCGVRVNTYKIWIFTLMGVMAGLAGVLQFSRLTVGEPTEAVGLELDVIAAVVIGGGSLSGGEGSVVGTLIGALAMSFLRVGCTLALWPNPMQEIFIGIFIVAFVAIDQLRRARAAT